MKTIRRQDQEIEETGARQRRMEIIGCAKWLPPGRLSFSAFEFWLLFRRLPRLSAAISKYGLEERIPACFTLHHRTVEICPGKVCTTHVRATKIGHLRFRPLHLRTIQIRPLEIRLLQLRSA
jgi:hypothetical protein